MSSRLSPGASFVFLILLLLLPGCDRNPDSPGEKIEPATIGQPAPDFILEDLEGKSWRLSDLRGKLVMINFWATWCPPCREELPSMEELHQEMTLAGKEFQMLSILNNDDPGQAGNLARRLNITFPILKDPNDQAARAYGLTGVPETFIIDAAGIVRQKVIGGRNWSSPQAITAISEYLPRSD